MLRFPQHDKRPPGVLLRIIIKVFPYSFYKRYATDDASRLYCYNKNLEVDFYVPEEAMAIQVSYSLEDPETRKREINALSLLHKAFPLKKALVITYDEESTMEINGLPIEFVPVWKWLLQ